MGGQSPEGADPQISLRNVPDQLEVLLWKLIPPPGPGAGKTRLLCEDARSGQAMQHSYVLSMSRET